jgi:hypothetical protein
MHILGRKLRDGMQRRIAPVLQGLLECPQAVRATG